MSQLPRAAAERAARRAEHWAARQARQLQERGPAGLADAWLDRVRKICTDDPELWNDLVLTLENWAGRHDGSHGA